MGIFDDIEKVAEEIIIHKGAKEHLNNQRQVIEKTLDEKIDHLRNIKKESLKKLVKASTFDVSIIGPVIASLMSSMENNEYTYHTALYKTTCQYYEEGYGYDYSRSTRNVYLISDIGKARNEYSETYLSEIGPCLFRDQKDVVLLAMGYLDEGKISFYSTTGKTNVDVKKYTYIYDFINYVVDYSVENNMYDLSQEDLFGLLSDFLNGYKKGNAKIKKEI